MHIHMYVAHPAADSEKSANKTLVNKTLKKFKMTHKTAKNTSQFNFNILSTLDKDHCHGQTTVTCV